MLNSEYFEHKTTFGRRSLIFQVRLLPRSCDRRLSVIVTDVSITSAEVIIRVIHQLMFIRVLEEQTPPPPPRGKFKQLWALVSFPIILVSPISIPIEELH